MSGDQSEQPAQQSNQLLKPEVATKILISSIATKVKKGKSLSARELAIVQTYAQPGTVDTPEWVGGYEALGAIFNCHRTMFHEWRKKFDDCPKPRTNGGHSVLEWRQWFERHPEVNQGDEQEQPQDSKKTWEIERLRQQCRQLKRDNDVNDGRLINVEQQSEWLLGLAKESSAILFQKLVNEMPALVAGMDTAHARILAKRIFNQCMEPLRKLIQKPEFRRLLEQHESDVTSDDSSS